METKRRQQILLAVLLVVLAGVGYRAWTSMTSPLPAPTSNGTGAAAAQPRRSTQQPAAAAPDVHLEALTAERPKPGAAERDLFRFKPKPPPPPPKPVALPPAPPAPTGPPPPPPPPPIPYKFIGKLEGNGQTGRIAVLSDGRGAPLYGREGDIIEGRYRILRIGAESIEMEHLDGRGRQTIRLGGS